MCKTGVRLNEHSSTTICDWSMVYTWSLRPALNSIAEVNCLYSAGGQAEAWTVHARCTVPPCAPRLGGMLASMELHQQPEYSQEGRRSVSVRPLYDPSETPTRLGFLSYKRKEVLTIEKCQFFHQRSAGDWLCLVRSWTRRFSCTLR